MSESRVYCPGCEPLADEFAELLELQWCGTHLPPRAGTDDALAWCEHGTSSDAEINRAFCQLIHGGRP